MTATLTGVLATLFGVIVGFVLNQVAARLTRRGRISAHREALRHELELCGSIAQTAEKGEVKAPLYRLPTVIYTVAFPALIADRAFKGKSSGALLEYFNQVETLNRGLDQAQAARGTDALEEEVGRNRLKASRLVPGQELFQRAHALLS